MDRSTLNAFKKLPYSDPATFLIRLRKLEIEVAQSDLPYKIRSLRTNELKATLEQRQAALFCFGMSQKLGHPVCFASYEDQDFDFVASWVTEGQQHLAPVQLKEVVPSFVNPATTLDAVIAGLNKYTDSAGLTVAIHLNQEKRFEPRHLQLTHLKIAAVWIFAAASADQSRWNLWGNFVENQQDGIQFTYPTEA